MLRPHSTRLFSQWRSTSDHVCPIGKFPIRPIDVDMSGAHPCFVVDVIGDLFLQSIVQYVTITQREDILKKCMKATGLSRSEAKPLYNIPFFADDKWKFQYWEK